MSNAVTLEWVDNSIAWGEVVGKHHKFDLVECTSGHHYRPLPGWLVTCYEGELKRMQSRGDDYPGLGIIIAVVPHPRPKGSVNWLCLVLWNFDKPEFLV